MTYENTSAINKSTVSNNTRSNTNDTPPNDNIESHRIAPTLQTQTIQPPTIGYISSYNHPNATIINSTLETLQTDTSTRLTDTLSTDIVPMGSQPNHATPPFRHGTTLDNTHTALPNNTFPPTHPQYDPHTTDNSIPLLIDCYDSDTDNKEAHEYLVANGPG